MDPTPLNSPSAVTGLRIAAGDSARDPAPAVPGSFLEYVRSFGPGLVAVLTWLGAGDIVAAGVAGGNYGYALMWAMVLAILTRYCFVSMIARYQLCNPRGEGVLDGLARLHRWYAPFLFFSALIWGHLTWTYMGAGVGELSVSIAGFGPKWAWQLFWVAVVASAIFRPTFKRVQIVFKIAVGMLGVSLIGTALWVGPDIGGVLSGVFTFRLPPQQGPFDAMLVALGMIGATGGSLMNLAYPYFLEQKGWTSPKYRRVQTYDFLLATIVMIILNLSVWTLGAKLVYGSGGSISGVEDLAGLLGAALGAGGRLLFLFGVLMVILTSLMGGVFGLGCLASHAWERWHKGEGPLKVNYRESKVYRFVVIWVVLTPLVWIGRADFIAITLLANTLIILLVPVLAGGLWWITASSKYLDDRYRNRWWHNVFMASLFVLAIYGTWKAAESAMTMIRSMTGAAT